jgi:hypothetical protein
MDSLIYHALLNQYPGTNAIAYHVGESVDPFANFRGKNITGLLNLIGSPCAQIDRTLEYGSYYDSTYTKFLSRYNNFQFTPIGINVLGNSYNISSGEFSVSFNCTTSQILTGLYCYQLMIYENNLIYPQAEGLCGGGQNFVHQLVAREISNERVYGDTLMSGTWNANQSISKTISTSIKTNWIADNCRFIIVVYKLNGLETLSLAEVQQTKRGNVASSNGIRNDDEFARGYSLFQNYPNPFNPITNIKFSIPKDGFTELKVFDLLGKEITTLCNQRLQKGIYNVECNADKLSSGTYFYTLRTDEFTSTKRMVVLK